jgi:hypothetical protein
VDSDFRTGMLPVLVLNLLIRATFILLSNIKNIFLYFIIDG